MKRRRFMQAALAAVTVPFLPKIPTKPEHDLFISPDTLEEIGGWEEHKRVGFYSYSTIGFAVLDNRKTLLGEFE